MRAARLEFTKLSQSARVAASFPLPTATGEGWGGLISQHSHQHLVLSLFCFSFPGSGDQIDDLVHSKQSRIFELFLLISYMSPEWNASGHLLIYLFTLRIHLLWCLRLVCHWVLKALYARILCFVACRSFLSSQVTFWKLWRVILSPHRQTNWSEQLFWHMWGPWFHLWHLSGLLSWGHSWACLWAYGSQTRIQSYVTVQGYVSQLAGTESKFLGEPTERRKGLLWVTVSQVSVQNFMVSEIGRILPWSEEGRRPFLCSYVVCWSHRQLCYLFCVCFSPGTCWIIEIRQSEN